MRGGRIPGRRSPPPSRSTSCRRAARRSSSRERIGCSSSDSIAPPRMRSRATGPLSSCSSRPRWAGPSPGPNRPCAGPNPPGRPGRGPLPSPRMGGWPSSCIRGPDPPPPPPPNPPPKPRRPNPPAPPPAPRVAGRSAFREVGWDVGESARVGATTTANNPTEHPIAKTRRSIKPPASGAASAASPIKLKSTIRRRRAGRSSHQYLRVKQIFRGECAPSSHARWNDAFPPSRWRGFATALLLPPSPSGRGPE